MNKELPLDERIQKLFESGWVNEFNYLENQLQEARYLLACLSEKYNQLTNQLKEFKEEHKIMKQILIENGLWERLLNDDRFLKYLRDDDNE